MSTKRQRRDEPSSAPSSSRDQDSDPCLLTAVCVVCRDATPQLQPLLHVISAINAFLDVSSSRTVEFACSIGSVRLLQRIVAGYEKLPETSVQRDPLFRQIQFSAGMKAACKAGHLAAAQWRADSPPFEACFMPTQAPRNAVKHGHVHVLEWLRKGRSDTCWRHIFLAVDGKHLNVAQWLQPMAGRKQCNGRAMIIPAAEAGNLEMVKWAYKLKGKTPAKTRDAVQVAARGGHVHVVQWLLEQKGPSAAKDVDASELLKEGDLETLKMLLKHRGKLTDETWVYGQLNAVSRGRHDVAKRLYALGYNFEKAGSYELTNAIQLAATRGRVDMLKWLAANKVPVLLIPLDCTEEGVTKAAAHAHLHVLRWLHERKSKGFKKKAMDEAAAYNRLEVVQWLHTQRGGGCTTHAMDKAAQAGHLDMVKWLHSNRREGATTEAMDGAAREGHLEVVKWLSANRTEGCTTKAIDCAARSGHFEVVKWLYANRSEGFTPRAIEGSTWRGQLGMLKWFIDIQPESCTAEVMDSAARSGNFEAVLFLHRERSEGCTSRAIPSALWLYEHREFFPWFYANYPEHARTWASDFAAESELMWSADFYDGQLISTSGD